AHANHAGQGSLKHKKKAGGSNRPFLCVSYRAWDAFSLEVERTRSGQHSKDHGCYEGERSTDHQSIDRSCKSHWHSPLRTTRWILRLKRLSASGFCSRFNRFVSTKFRCRSLTILFFQQKWWAAACA